MSARRPRTLRRTLVIGIAALVATALVAVGLVSVLTLSASLTAVVDSQLTGSLAALEHSVTKYRHGRPDGEQSTDPKGFDKPLVDFVGHGPGSIIAMIQGGEVIDSAYFSEQDARVCDQTVAQQLAAAAVPGKRVTVDLEGLGSYRITAQDDEGDGLLVAGVSMATANAAVMQATGIIGILALLAVALTVVGAVIVVRLALRPLARVVGTAVEVAHLPLDKGDVAITTRVDAVDTDPRTEVGKVGEALNRLLEHVDDALAVRSAADKRIRRFVTDASHELRTPLAAIQGYAELTRQDADLSDLTEHALGRIESEATRMSSLVSDLLLLARLDEGQDLHMDEIDLAEIVVNAISDARASAPDQEWVVDVPEGPVLVQGDRERLHQLVANLLSNAATHTPPGTRVTARLERSAELNGAGAVRLSVRDDGPGIPADLLPELFQRFTRGDSSRSREAGSTGLGLAIVASIVEAHSGQITVESSPTGTVFTVMFASIDESAP